MVMSVNVIHFLDDAELSPVTLAAWIHRMAQTAPPSTTRGSDQDSVTLSRRWMCGQLWWKVWELQDTTLGQGVKEDT